MNTTTIPTEVEALIEDALDTFINSAPGEFGLMVCDLLDMDEDEMVERFGSDLSDRLCALEISGECEWFEVEPQTWETPAHHVLSGNVSVWDSNLGRDIASSAITEDGFTFGTWI